MLRFYHLGFNSLWLDEAYTYHFARLSFSDRLEIFQGVPDFHPPLFYELEKIGLLFGNSENSLKNRSCHFRDCGNSSIRFI